MQWALLYLAYLSIYASSQYEGSDIKKDPSHQEKEDACVTPTQKSRRWVFGLQPGPHQKSEMEWVRN